MRRWIARFLGGAVAATAALAAAPVGAAAQVGSCHDTQVPVTLAPGLPADQHAFAELCLPAGKPAPATVQVLLHGMTYNHEYWTLPDPTGRTDRYSYVAAANRAGYATLAIDRIGAGVSSHPLGLTLWTQTNAWVVHQLIQDLRAGTIVGPAGAVRFGKVVEVAHSLGSAVEWLETSEYHDVDGVIITGATHHPNYVSVAGIATQLYPAALDPQFQSSGLDPTYLTTVPGARTTYFYDNGSFDPALAAWDEAHKDVGNVAELAETGQEFLAQPLDIRAPVLEVLGQNDVVYCGANDLETTVLVRHQCDGGAALVAAEAGSLGPHVPSVDGFVLPRSGHDLNAMFDAGQWFAVAQQWIDAHVGGAA